MYVVNFSKQGNLWSFGVKYDFHVALNLTRVVFGHLAINEILF